MNGLRAPLREIIMIKSSRVLASVVVLGLFCFVIAMATGRANVSAPQGNSDVKTQWEETRGGSTTKP